MESKYFVESSDLSSNAIQLPVRVEAVTVYQVNLMWGLGVFGETGILGSGWHHFYETGADHLNLRLDDLSLNVIYRAVAVWKATVSSPMLTWGSAMFGSSSILGRGLLILQED